MLYTILYVILCYDAMLAYLGWFRRNEVRNKFCHQCQIYILNNDEESDLFETYNSVFTCLPIGEISQNSSESHLGSVTAIQFVSFYKYY